MAPVIPSGLRVLIIDDERNIRTTLALCLESSGCAVEQASSAVGARAALDRATFDLAFLDLRLGDSNGLDLLPELLSRSPDLDVVMVTAYATVDNAVEAMKRGARDVLPKPFTPAQVRHVVQTVSERSALARRVAHLEARLSESAPDVELETRSPQMRSVLEQVKKAAEHEVPVLLLGESGTGKGVLAQAVHAFSRRRDKPFVTVNCPTLSEDLLASELFGHAKGAFTGAVRDQAGRVEAAAGGTLFLDEIGEIPASLQAKLLRFLQDRRFERLGETQTRVADVRIVAASNRVIEAEVKAGRFREDLYFRLNTVEVTLPPLRDRPEDILPLTERFLGFFARAMRRRVPVISPAAQAAIQSYGWPGNVRELRNSLERAMIFMSGDSLGADVVSQRLGSGEPPGPRLGGPFTLEQVERAHIEKVVAASSSLDEAARSLGIDASTLYRRRKKLGDA